MARILVVDDDVSILMGLEALLTHEGYAVETAADGREALDRFRANTPDLVLLDLLLPEVSGLEVCQEIRGQQASVPVLMLTAKGEEEDKVLGLDLGADDYMVKPFGTRELLARIKAALRRRPARPPRKEQYDLGDFQIDCRRHELVAGGNRTELTAREFSLLVYLVERRGALVTREELLESVWGYRDGQALDTRTVDNYIARLRRKIEPDVEQPRYITTRRGAGYLFEAD